MGIADLKPFLKKKSPNCFVKIPAKELSKKRIAIDGLNWLFTYLGMVVKSQLDKVRNFEEVNEKTVFRGLLKIFLSFNTKLMTHKIIPIWIWDGTSMPAKLETKEKRREDRKKRVSERERIKLELDSMSVLERPTELIEKYKKLFAQTFYLPMDNVGKLKEISQSIGIPTITAKSEGEKLAAELAVSRHVACVWSSDTDTYAFGAPFVTRKIDLEMGELVIDGIFTLSILEELDMSHQQFRDFCVMCGCDFGKRVKGMGPVKSFQLIKKYKTIENIEKHENYDFSCLNYKECRQLLTPEKLELDLEDLEIIHHEYDEDLDKYDLRSDFEIFLSRTRNIPKILNVPRLVK